MKGLLLIYQSVLALQVPKRWRFQLQRRADFQARGQRLFETGNHIEHVLGTDPARLQCQLSGHQYFFEPV